MAEKEESAEAAVRTLRRVTRKRYSAGNKLRIVLEGLRGETSIAGLSRREGFPSNLSNRWSKDFLDAGKRRLVGDTTSTGVLRISLASRTLPARMIKGPGNRKKTRSLLRTALTSYPCPAAE